MLTDTIIVTAQRQGTIGTDVVAAPRQIALPADSAAIAARVAGGDIFGNGALSGQLSYRGLAGERVLGRVNGQRFATGGPNAMDPPLHYAPSILVERIDVARGVAPVAEGPSLGGAINAELVQAQFTDGVSLSPQMRVASQYRSVDDSYAVGGLAALASEQWRIGIIASREQGDDYRFPGGTAVGTLFERNLYGVHAGFLTGAGELFVEYRRSETDPSGNPPFALDMVYFDTDFVQGGFRGQIAEDVGLTVRLGHVAVRHLMDNQTLRQPRAVPAQARATFADADTMTAEAALRFGSTRAYLEVGADAETTDRFVTITNPTNPAFFIDSQPDIRAERFGAYLQWRGTMGTVQFELGGRIDRTEQSAGVPRLGTAVPMGPRGLANAFIASARSGDDTTFDGVARLWIEGRALTPRLTLARKTRVPSVLERFAWLPTEASFGLADGNIYVGNQALEPEVAWIAEAGFDLDNDWLTLRPTLFYRRVDGFIQGTPFDETPGVVNSPVEMVSAANGDPTPLQFRNTDAELYGADLDFVVRPVTSIELAGTASFTRGQRRDIADDLYRIPPADLRISATWSTGPLAVGAELFAAADQDRVSLTNDELAGDGFAVVGLFGRYAFSDGLALETGVESLFNAEYAPHLAGRSRVGASDVAVGERLRGQGRGLHLTAKPSVKLADAVVALRKAITEFAPVRTEIAAYGLAPQIMEALAPLEATHDLAKTQLVKAEAVVASVQTLYTAAVVAMVFALSDGSAPIIALAVLASGAGIEAAGGLTRNALRKAGIERSLARLADLSRSPEVAAPYEVRPTPAAPLMLGATAIAPGERIAISGISGSGKTRLIMALAGLRPAAHLLRVGGVPIAEVSADDLRRQFALAPQDPALLVGTVADNLRIAAPGIDADMMLSALRIVALETRIAAAPEGLDTWLSSDGGFLSGGERKRLALARALLARRPWLLLDEPTEGLDNVTEQAVISNLAGWLDQTGAGLILVSHRPAALPLSARVIPISAITSGTSQ